MNALFLLALIALSVVAARIALSRERTDAVFGPQLYARVQALFEPFEGQKLSAEAFEELERDAARTFVDVLTGVGLTPGDWHLRVHVDELLGPVPHIHGPENQVFDLAEFQQRLRDRRIEL